MADGFFSQMRHLARSLDHDVSCMKDEFNTTERQFCYPVVMKKVTDMKTDAKDRLVSIVLNLPVGSLFLKIICKYFLLHYLAMGCSMISLHLSVSR